MTWKYIGDGVFFPGVPARDLTDDEAEEYRAGDLDIYEYEEATPAAAPARTRRSGQAEEPKEGAD
jgi:hypothetical protein